MTVISPTVRAPLAGPPVGALRQAAPELSEADAVRFLQRATFGPTEADVARLLDIGVDAWLDEQLATERRGSLHYRVDQTDRFAPSLWQGYLSGTDQLRKRVAYALSQIFVVSNNGVAQEAVAWYADRLEDGAFGTYRELIETITRSHAMAGYLTFLYSRKADERTGRMPDENYAREILQLFSIGLDELNQDGTRRLDAAGQPIPTYGQDDIIGLARVFTGYVANVNDGEDFSASHDRRIAKNPRSHSPEEKRFLGTVIPAGTGMDDTMRLALDAIAAHPNVGPFLGRQLIQRLVTSNPSPSYVRRVARVWADDGTGTRGNLAAVVRTVLTDPEAWRRDRTTGAKLREPVLRFTAITRLLGIRSSEQPWRIWDLSDPAETIGQMPFAAPSVFNFYRPGYVPPQTPLGDQVLLAPEFQIANEASVIGWVNFIAWFIRYPVQGISYRHLADFRRLASDPAALVDRLATLLCARPLRADVRSIVIDQITAIDFGSRPDVTETERVTGAITMIAASPDFLVEQ